MKVSRPGQGTPNEWRYVQPETGAVFHAFSYWELADKVRKHRAAMNLDLAKSWEDRFQDDLCRQNEEAPCHGRVDTKKDSRRLTLQDLRRFMSTISKWDGTLVAREEAERRAAICIACPKNQSVRGCWGCAGLLKEVVKFLQGKKGTTVDSALESCGVCGCVLRAKVWMPLDTKDGLEYPSHCWQRATPSGSAGG
jgi:hypothetical protein